MAVSAAVRGRAAGPEDDPTTRAVLERLDAAYGEVVAILLGHIRGSDIDAAQQRADRIDAVLDELREVACALRRAIMLGGPVSPRNGR